MKKRLCGHGESYKGTFNVEPTEKQVNIIQKLRAYYGKKIPYVRTRNEAWHLISRYSDVIKYDKERNEFYIEDNIVTKTTVALKSIESDEDVKCKEIIKRTKEILNEEQLKAYEAFLSAIGDYNDVIIEVSEKLIEQIEETKTKKTIKKMSEFEEEQMYLQWIIEDSDGYAFIDD